MPKAACGTSARDTPPGRRCIAQTDTLGKSPAMRMVVRRFNGTCNRKHGTHQEPTQRQCRPECDGPNFHNSWTHVGMGPHRWPQTANRKGIVNQNGQGAATHTTGPTIATRRRWLLTEDVRDSRAPTTENSVDPYSNGTCKNEACITLGFSGL